MLLQCDTTHHYNIVNFFLEYYITLSYLSDGEPFWAKGSPNDKNHAMSGGEEEGGWNSFLFG